MNNLTDMDCAVVTWLMVKTELRLIQATQITFILATNTLKKGSYLKCKVDQF